MKTRMLVGALTIALATPFGLAAQAAEDMSNEGPAMPVTMSMKGLHDITSGNVMATAEMLDEEMYAYRPTEEVRTTGEILAHIAGAQFMFCAAAGGVDNPNAENFEQTATTKADIMAALESGFDFCNGVYESMTDERGAEMVEFFGNKMAASAVLAFNAAHNYEHYGNLVTYMRINGITPPSSM